MRAFALPETGGMVGVRVVGAKESAGRYSISHGGHEHAASADGDGGGHAGGCDRIARRRHRGALVVARRSARQRRHGRTQHRQPRAQARGRLRGGAVQEGRTRAGRRAGGYIQPVAFKTRKIDEVEVEPGAGEERQDRAAHARRGREHQRAGRSGAVGRRAARLRRLRPEHPRAQHRRLRGREPEGRDRGLHLVRRRSRCPGPLQAHFGSAAERWKMYKAAGAIGTVSIANPKSMDIPWARSTLARLQPAMSLADPALDEARRAAAVGHDEPGARRQAVRRLGPHLRARCSRSSTATSRCRASRCRRGSRRRRAVERSQVESQNVAGILRGVRSEAARRVRRRLGAPRSSRRRRAGQRRHDLQRRDGQRLGHRGDPRGGGVAARERREAGAVDAVRRGHRRGEGPARLALLRRAPHRAAREHRRQRQHRHVPAAVPAEDADGARPRRVGSRAATSAPRAKALGVSRAGRSRAAAQPLRPQRSVQLHPGRRSGAGDEGGLRREHAGGGDRGEVDRRALSRAVGRPESADRSVGGRQVRRGRARSRGPHRQPRPTGRSGTTRASSSGSPMAPRTRSRSPRSPSPGRSSRRGHNRLRSIASCDDLPANDYAVETFGPSVWLEDGRRTD